MGRSDERDEIWTHRAEQHIISDREHATVRCSCLEFKTVEHILFKREKYEAERRNLVRKLKSSKSQLSIDILRQKEERKEFQVLFQYLREIKALKGK